MLTTKQTYQYNTFGLSISSEIQLPELFPTPFYGEGDVHIEVSDLTQIWEQKVSPNTQVFVERNFVLFQIPDLAIFCIRDGNSIVFSPFLNLDLDKIRLYLLGTCMGTILLQKKILGLHGSAIAINGKAYAFIGESGVGKSTLASAFILQDFKLISDDVIAINFDNQNNPIMMPSYPQQKLWKESLIKFGMDSKKYQPLFERETKFAVPVENPVKVPIELAGVIELEVNDSDSIKYEKIKGLNKIATLFQHTYRSSFINRLELSDWHFKETVKLLDKIQINKLSRPKNQFTAHELVAVVLDNI
ncbi:aldolase [Fictibacillus barbaricus]|uniref:aldolase n=1 Tax=Fictibacillus barbaricus TaxID=182136 RepID=UPI00286AFE0E|nr:aldolase [Fictibacillus barbaricus]